MQKNIKTDLRVCFANQDKQNLEQVAYATLSLSEISAL